MKAVIIGNGAAGLSAAAAVRKFSSGSEITMISREPEPGYSACALPDCLAGWVPRSRLYVADQEKYQSLGIKTIFGREVKALDLTGQQVVLEQGRVDYTRLILATGSRALIPPIQGSNLNGNYVLKTMSDLDQISKNKTRRVVVIGSGNIGVETAEALEIQGAQVTLIEMLERIMPKVFDLRPSQILQNILEKRGIRVLTGERVTGIDGSEQVAAVITDKREIPCDTVIWAVGVRQNVELAREAGLQMGNLGGVRVNTRMETSAPGVYACGDCTESFNMITGQPELSLLWPSAKRQGEIAGSNCAGQALEYEGSFSVVVEEIYSQPCISLGFTAEALADACQEIIERETEDSYYRLVLADGKAAGFQSIGLTRGAGALMALIKTRTPVREVERIMENRQLLKAVPWYGEAARYLFPEKSRCN